MAKIAIGSDLMLMMWYRGGSNCLVNRPSQLNDSGHQSGRMNTNAFRQLGNSQLIALISNLHITPNIVRLYLLGSPSTIFRGIVSIVVNSINGMLGRALTHIDYKVFQSIFTKPPFTNLNVALFVADMCWVIVGTTRNHVLPGRIFGGVAQSMSFIASISHLNAKTTTGFAPVEAKIAVCDYFLFPAIALANPTANVSSALCLAENNQPAKSLTRKIYEFIHNLFISQSAFTVNAGV